MTQSEDSDLLARLATSYGIADHYFDIWGTRHEPTADTLRAVLHAMGVAVENHDALVRELVALHSRYWTQVCDPVVVRQVGQAGVWNVRAPSLVEEDGRWRLSWTLSREDGAVERRGEQESSLEVVEQAWVEAQRYIRVQLPIPSDLAMGYYDAEFRLANGARHLRCTCRLIVTPTTCYVPPRFHADARTWGLWVQLYALRSRRNWGVGDLTDLGALVQWAGGMLGAGLVGLNPLHALKNRQPYHSSPYSPQSRAYLNELYVDIERIPEFQACRDAQRLVSSDAFVSRLEALRKSEWVDYEALAAAKRDVLELLYRSLLSEAAGPEDIARQERRRTFERFCREQGDSLERYATFLALSEAMERRGRTGSTTWREWPEEYRDPRHPAVEVFRERSRERLGFHQYVQWVTEEQLQAVVAKTHELGMAVGLYHDFALGSDPNGAESWLLQDVLAHDADCGCPPDAFALQGQNWGFPPFDPVKLRQQAYQPFIELLRRNLTRGGALRLDHVMGLFRLFWIPKGQLPAAGAYVQYPFEELLGILALESQRAQTIVIGEDLGTVPDWVREQLAVRCALSYRVWYFERRPDGSWKSPGEYPAQSLVVTTTHDLPTLPGFWACDDLRMRERAGLFPTETSRRQAWDDRARDKQGMVEALQASGDGLGVDPDASRSLELTTELSESIHRFLARTPAWLALASLDDWAGERAQANVPGTVEAYPNWSRKFARSLEELQHDPTCARLAAVMNEERGRRS